MKPSLIKNKIFKNFGVYFLQFILTIFVIYFLVLVFLYFYQRNLLYHPNENNYSGDKIAVDIKKVKIQTSDNIELLGSLLASAFLIGLATTLTRSSMIGFFDVLPVYILMGIAIFMMIYEAFFDKK